MTVRTKLTPEEQRRADLMKAGVWPGLPKKAAGEKGKAEAEKRFGNGRR